LGAEALCGTWLSVASAPDRLVAFVVAAEPVPLRYLRVGQNRSGRITFRNRRYRDNTGTEATMHAMRIARAYTGRDRIVKFEGQYHGVHDYALISVAPDQAPTTLAPQLTPYGQEPGLVEPLVEPRSGVTPTSGAPEVP